MPHRINRLSRFKALTIKRVIIPLLIIVGIASFGTYKLIASHAATLGDRLSAGQTLQPGEQLRSADTGMKLIMQTDGNLVLYNHDNKPVWQSNTTHKGYSVTLQSDGNFVMYDKAGKTAVWQSATRRGTILVVQNDGNVVLSSSTAYIWNTATAGKEGTPLPVAATKPTSTTKTTAPTTTPSTTPPKTTTPTTTSPTTPSTTPPKTTTPTTTSPTTPSTTTTTGSTKTSTTTTMLPGKTSPSSTRPIITIATPIVLTNPYAAECPAPRPILQEGATGNCVKYLQQIFKNSGFAVTVNGTFDSTTYSAVVFYQAIKKIPDNGVVNAQTWGALTGSSQVTTQTLGKGAASANQYASSCAPPRPILQEGATGNCVKYLQQIFKSSGFAVNVTGTFDMTTYSAVVFYQANKKYTADGVVNSQTWSALTDNGSVTKQVLGKGVPQPPKSSTSAANQFATSCAAPRPILQEGASGNCVKYLQQIFKGAGFNIVVDGSFGPITQSAVIFFQGTKGLTTNGVVGATTWNALTGDNRLNGQTLGNGTWAVAVSSGNYGGGSNYLQAIGSGGGNGGGSASSGAATTCDSACQQKNALYSYLNAVAGAGGFSGAYQGYSPTPAPAAPNFWATLLSSSRSGGGGATTGQESTAPSTTRLIIPGTGLSPLTQVKPCVISYQNGPFC